MSNLAKALTIALAATALLAAGSVHAETGPVVAPKAADVTTLRQLLALQYPSLRHVSASPATVVPAPSVTAEPVRGDASAPAEGGA